MLQLNRQLPAKVLKRAAQLGRLGPRGLMHTAYVRTLAPAVYSLTDPARQLAAARHRRKMLGNSLGHRIAELKTCIKGEVSPGRLTGRRFDFGADTGRFVQTLEALLDLKASGCAVPDVIEVDWSQHTIATRLVPGEPWAERSRHGNDETIGHVESALTAIHRAGYVLGEFSSGDIFFASSGKPVFTNLRNALPLAGLSRDMSIHFRDLDRSRCNRLLGTRLLTAFELRSLLSPSASIPHDGIRGRFREVYAPVVIRDDIRWGKIWNTDLGTGRWNFIMEKHLPIPAGGSVLDLGSNNGFNPLQMLRAGAASAIGIELHEPAIEQADFLRSAYEWLDNREYDFRSIHASIGDLDMLDLQRFDVVTALCCLYYLPDAEIRELVAYIRTLTDTFVVQCNTDRLIDRGGDEETFRKASVEYAVEVLEQGGFTDRTIVAPPGYSRPLIIARAA